MTMAEKFIFMFKLLAWAPPVILGLLRQRVQAIMHRWTYRAVQCPKDIVIIGGSFAGVRLASRLAKSVPTGYRVTLIERNSHFNYLINFARYSVLAGHEDYGFIPYEGIQNGAPQGAFRYLQNIVTGIEDGKVHLKSGETVDFAYLALATGSQQAYPERLVATEKEEGCKKLQNMQESIRQATRIAVIGGGAVGIELATDIKSFYAGKDVTIYHSKNRLLSRFGPRLHEHVLTTLQKAGIHIVLQERPKILEDDNNALRLLSGRIEHYDLVLPCTGQKAKSDLVRDLAPEAVCKETKQILVRPTLQIATGEGEGKDKFANVFALGDVAATGGAKNARSSFFQTEIVVKNILGMIKEDIAKSLYKPNTALEGAIMLTLGQQDAVVYLQENNGADILMPVKLRSEDLYIKRAWGEMNVDFPEIPRISKAHHLQPAMSTSQEIPVSANVLGTIGTVLWCVQLVPQIWHNWRHKKTDGLPASMMLLWATCAVPFGVYMILQLCEIPYRKGITWPALIFGVIAALMLAVGFVPIYLEIWSRRGRVIGVTAEGSFDILGGILYIIVFLAELGIFVSHIIWRFRHRKLLKTAKESGKSVDELLLEQERQHNNSNDEKQDSLTVANAPVQVGGDEGATRRDNSDLERGPG
ncbi:hypothetical protein UA08_00683 [Talaromyces atroroseus]|uniref:FAD/NAD(P)-binding domain-containing protein n=1 Tax=Talaromyces atroroseus TaxID=1441469 RepID=A0A225ARX9_TALAT|nr:hypothetical protein UA08_00683 [Talaromyces atroroseus]OKL64341.1 hypothetical protein UA08_00683 [Talaromyces atroroseus]